MKKLIKEEEEVDMKESQKWCEVAHWSEKEEI